MNKFKDLSGKVFGNWIVIKRDTSTYYRAIHWICICTCGKTSTILGASLSNGSSLSCGCFRSKLNSIKFSKRPYESIYNTLVYVAKTKKLSVLTYDEFLEFTKIKNCFYCGTDINWTEYNRRINNGRYNLDRIDSSIGYIPINLVVSCFKCNHAKSNVSIEEFICICKSVTEYQKNKKLCLPRNTGIKNISL